jgi:hypothetical protein
VLTSAALAGQARSILERRKAAIARVRAAVESLRKTLGKKQRAFMASKAPRRTLGGSRQSGKSHTLATTLIETGFERKCESMYVAPTSKAARNAVWSKLHELNDRFRLGIELKEGAFKAKFPNGSTVGFEGAHDSARVKRLRGATLTGVLCIDESAFFPDALLRELMGPTASAMFLASPNGQRMIAASSPGMQRRGHFFELCHMHTEQWQPHHLTIFDNPVVKDPQKALAELRDANAWTEASPAYQREGLGLWIDDATHAVYELSELNLVDGFPDAKWTTVMTIDFGSNDQSAIAVAGWRDHDPNFYVLHVEGASEMDIEDVAQRALPLIARWSPIGVYGDHGGGGAQHADYLRKRHRIPVRPVAKKQNYKAAAIDAFNADARRGLVRALRSSPLVEQMQALQWDSTALAKGKREEHPSMPNDLCDVTLYAHMHSRQYRAEPEPVPPPQAGTDEHWKQWSDAGLARASAQAAAHNQAIEEAEEERALLVGADWEA